MTSPYRETPEEEILNNNAPRNLKKIIKDKFKEQLLRRKEEKDEANRKEQERKLKIIKDIDETYYPKILLPKINNYINNAASGFSMSFGDMQYYARNELKIHKNEFHFTSGKSTNRSYLVEYLKTKGWNASLNSNNDRLEIEFIQKKVLDNIEADFFGTRSFWDKYKILLIASSVFIFLNFIGWCFGAFT